MVNKLLINFLIIISSSLFLFACKQGAKKAVLPDPTDSLGNIEGVKAISREIVNNPLEAELFYRRAQIYANQKLLNRAEDDFVAAIQLDSINPLYHFHLARILYAMNQTRQSAVEYEKAIALKPDYTEAIMKLADLYFVVKEHNKSINLLNKSMKMDQGNARIYHLLGLNYKELGDTGRAIYHFQTAIENDPDDFESNLYLANLYAAKKKIIAMEYFQAALKLRPKSVDALFGRAVFEQNIKQYKSALLDYRRVIDLDPQNFLAYYNVGYLNYENGMMDEALRSWNTCTQMNPNYANAFYMKGLVYEERKNKSDALINYRVAAELEPDNTLFASALKRLGS